MKEYHKIQTVYKRNPENKKMLMEGCFTLPEFEFLRGLDWVYTEKVDGTNIRVIFDGMAIEFRGKTDNASIPAILIKRLQDRFLWEIDRFKSIFQEATPKTPACLYGEGYGKSINKKGMLYRHDQDFVLFDVKVDTWWLERDNIEDVAEKFGLDVVPIIGYGTLDAMIEKVRQGFQSQWGDFLAEGIVAKPRVELFNRKGERIITKIKHRDFPTC